jgi:hypothetical protein
MNKIHLILGAALGLSIALGAIPTAHAAPVAQVVSVDVNGDLDTYLGLVKQLRALQSKLAPNATLRVWQASLAGQGSGTVVVVIEHPSLEAYAANTTKVQADAEWTKLIGKLQKTDREVLSNSLMNDITP